MRVYIVYRGPEWEMIPVDVVTSEETAKSYQQKYDDVSYQEWEINTDGKLRDLDD